MKTLFRLGLLASLIALAMPARGQDAYNTPAWHAWMHEANTSEDPRMQEAYGIVASWSNQPGIYGLWDYFHAVMLEDDQPAAAAAKYAEAIETSNSFMTYGPGGNYTHQSQWWAILNGRLQSRLTAAQSAAWRDAQIARCKDAMGWGQWGPVTRLGDSDMVEGAWGMIFTTDVIMGTDFYTLNSANATDGTDWVGCSWKEMDALVAKLCRNAKRGGENWEGTQYGLGTAREIAFTVGVVGINHPRLHPDIREYVLAAGANQPWVLTPGLQDKVFWGDNEGHRSLHGHYRGPLLDVLASVTGDPTGDLLAMSKRIYVPDSASWIAYHHSILTTDPRSRPLVPVVNEPVGFLDTGVGLSVHRGPSRLVQSYAPVPMSGDANEYIDHQMAQWNARWWQGGSWLLDSIMSYMPWSRCHNGSECYGFQPPYGVKVNYSRETATGFEAEYEAAEPPVLPGWDPASPFIRKWTRNTTLADGRMVFRDRIDATDPGTMPKMDRRGAGAESLYAARIAPVAQFFHAPPGRAVTAIPNGFTWQNAAGVEMKLLTNATVRSTATAVHEVNVGTYMEESELGGTIMQLGADWDVTTVVGLASDAGMAVPPPAEPPPPPTEPLPAPQGEIGEAVIIDDAAATYTGEWVAWTPTGYGGDLHYTLGGEKDATWKATVTPGKYRVAATWPEYANRATNAAFTVTGGPQAVSATINQELAPATFAAGEVRWQTLGEIDVAGTEITVKLDARNADENVIADAIRITKIGEPPAPPPPPPADVEIQIPVWYRVKANGEKELIIKLP